MTPKQLIKADLYRQTGRVSRGLLIKHLLVNPSFNYVFWFRLCRARSALVRGFARLMHKHLSVRYQIQLPKEVQVGPGLYLGHGTGIIVNASAKIGANCNLSPYTVIGSNHGRAAHIGDNVYIGPHTSVVEHVHIGDGAQVGAGAVVIKDVPAHATVVGNPAKVVREHGEATYIANPVQVNS
ncbi:MULTISPECIES: serine acetyltransferase [unclassified Pseudoalteromonas]|uniref:serine O-acetyltransferase n=1 Tax=unclassified Pseudoalteromonas TaxID=194690 RepID=UPI0023B854E9|nr:serine acetyltransferase [Pseudoalteromonas sp. CnMc7-15]